MKAIMLDAVLLFPGVGYGVDTSILGHSRVKGRFPYSNERRLWREFLKKTYSADIWRIMSGSGVEPSLHFSQDLWGDQEKLAVGVPLSRPKDYGDRRTEAAFKVPGDSGG